MPQRYLSYLLRLWQEQNRLPAAWRASVEDPQTGELQGFADIMQLFAFIEHQVSDETRPVAHKGPGGGPMGPSGDAQMAQTQKDPGTDSRTKPRQ
jgi:hypothetical protein